MFIGQFLEGNKMTPLKIHNGGSIALVEYLTYIFGDTILDICNMCAIFRVRSFHTWSTA